MERPDVDPENEIVPMRYWGKDHWSTLMYLEHRAVDKGGVIDKRQMRCDPRLHRELANVSMMGKLVDGSKYPTRLRDGETIAPHDNWSCVEDLVAYGLVEIEVDYNMEKRDRDGPFGHSEAVVTMTDEGRSLVAQLRQVKTDFGVPARALRALEQSVMKPLDLRSRPEC